MNVLKEMIKKADGYPDLSFTGFKLLWRAHGLSLLHVPPTSVDETNDDGDELEPRDHLHLKFMFRYLVELLLEYSHERHHVVTNRPKLTDATPTYARLPQCAYTIFAMYTLHATQSFVPKLPIALPESAWPCISTLLTQFSFNESTLHAAHVISRMQQDHAFEWVFDLPRSLVSEAAEWQVEWENDRLPNATEETHAVDDASAQKTLDDPEWHLSFSQEMESLGHKQQEVYQKRLPVHLDNLTVPVGEVLPLVSVSAKASLYSTAFQQVQLQLPMEMQCRADKDRRRIARAKAGRAGAAASSMSHTAAATSSYASSALASAPISSVLSGDQQPFEFRPLPDVHLSIATPKRSEPVIPAVEMAGEFKPDLRRALVPPLTYRNTGSSPAPAKVRGTRMSNMTEGKGNSATPQQNDVEFVHALRMMLQREESSNHDVTSMGDSSSDLPRSAAAAPAASSASHLPSGPYNSSSTYDLLSLLALPCNPDRPLGTEAPESLPLSPIPLHPPRRSDSDGMAQTVESDSREHSFVYPLRTKQSRATVPAFDLPSHDVFVDRIETLRSLHEEEDSKQRSSNPGASSAARSAPVLPSTHTTSATDRAMKRRHAAVAAANNAVVVKKPQTIPKLQSATTTKMDQFKHLAAEIHAQSQYDIEQHMVRAKQPEPKPSAVRVKSEPAPSPFASMSVSASPHLLGALSSRYRRGLPKGVIKTELVEEDHDGEEEHKGEHNADASNSVSVAPIVRQPSTIVGPALADIAGSHFGSSSILRTPILQQPAPPQRAVSSFDLDGAAGEEEERKENTLEPTATDLPARKLTPAEKKAAREAAAGRIKAKKEAAKTRTEEQPQQQHRPISPILPPAMARISLAAVTAAAAAATAATASAMSLVKTPVLAPQPASAPLPSTSIIESAISPFEVESKSPPPEQAAHKLKGKVGRKRKPVRGDEASMEVELDPEMGRALAQLDAEITHAFDIRPRNIEMESLGKEPEDDSETTRGKKKARMTTAKPSTAKARKTKPKSTVPDDVASPRATPASSSSALSPTVHSRLTSSDPLQCANDTLMHQIFPGLVAEEFLRPVSQPSTPVFFEPPSPVHMSSSNVIPSLPPSSVSFLPPSTFGVAASSATTTKRKGGRKGKKRSAEEPERVPDKHIHNEEEKSDTPHPAAKKPRTKKHHVSPGVATTVNTPPRSSPPAPILPLMSSSTIPLDGPSPMEIDTDETEPPAIDDPIFDDESINHDDLAMELDLADEADQQAESSRHDRIASQPSELPQTVRDEAGRAISKKKRPAPVGPRPRKPATSVAKAKGVSKKSQMMAAAAVNFRVNQNEFADDIGDTQEEITETWDSLSRQVDGLMQTTNYDEDDT